MKKSKQPKEELSPQDVCARLIGKVIEGVSIDADKEVVVITLSNGFLEFSGDSLEMYYEVTVEHQPN